MTKKILLFLVEGLSDKDALEPILDVLIDSKKVHFEVIRYDLTTSEDIEMRALNMKQRISKVVKKFLENNHGFKRSHIEKIIFISDTDGCYIDEEAIHYSNTDQYFRYEDDGIYTDRPNVAVCRNQIKARNLDTINSASSVFNLPIEAYYFSCNLDHVLYEERNLEQSLKETYAFDFADRYEDKESEFIDFVGDRSLCFSFDYKDTWTKIKQGNNSLLKHTNLIVFFLNNIDTLKEDIRKKVETDYLN